MLLLNTCWALRSSRNIFQSQHSTAPERTKNTQCDWLFCLQVWASSTAKWNPKYEAHEPLKVTAIPLTLHAMPVDQHLFSDRVSTAPVPCQAYHMHCHGLCKPKSWPGLFLGMHAADSWIFGRDVFFFFVFSAGNKRLISGRSIRKHKGNISHTLCTQQTCGCACLLPCLNAWNAPRTMSVCTFTC